MRLSFVFCLFLPHLMDHGGVAASCLCGADEWVVHSLNQGALGFNLIGILVNSDEKEVILGRNFVVQGIENQFEGLI